MKPIDERALPVNVGADVRASTGVAAALRATPNMSLVESLLAMPHSGVEAFADPVALRYVESEFGPEALRSYLDAVPRAAELLETVGDVGWKASPLATALSLGHKAMAGEPFVYGAHLRLISNAVVKAVRGTGKRRIAVMMPFRHGKSVQTSVMTPVWFLANYPHLTVGLTAHSDSLSTTFARLVRNIIQEGSLGFNLSQDSQSVHQFHTEHGGGLWQGSTGSGIQGRGCQLLVIDDPYRNAEEAASRVYRDTVWQWLMTSALTRLQDAGVVVLCVTRFDEDDIIGRLQKGYDGTDPSQWEFIRLPALAEDDDALGRSKGQALWPAKRPLSELESFRAGMSEASWLSGFQQTPPTESVAGRAYKSFSEAAHVRPVEWEPGKEVRVSLDFNVDPACAVIGQVEETSDFFRRLLIGERRHSLKVFDEICIADSSTVGLIEEVGERLKALAARTRRLRVVVTGDASGSQRRSSAGDQRSGVPRTDWQIVREWFGRNAESMEARFEIRASNPGVRDRVNQVNSMLRSADGKVNFAIHPRCRDLIRDLLLVRFARDSHGNPLSSLDKRDSKLTHLSDALGYMVCSVQRPAVGERSEPINACV